LIKKISKKDQKDWEKFLSSKDKLFNKDNTAASKKYPLIKTVDLHGYSLDDANSYIEKIIYKSYELGVKKIIVITGKGLRSKNYTDPFRSKDFSILKNSVPNFIQNKDNLSKFISKIESAKISDGGEGAFYIYLKNKFWKISIFN